jgi:subtilisin family serine protease
MPMEQAHPEPHELVVDQRDRVAVEYVLREIDIPWTLKEENKPLRLAVLTRPKEDTKILRIQQNTMLVESLKGAFSAGGRRNAALTDLDLLLGMLRQWFRDRYHGWEPTVDKNHSLDWVQGAPVKKGAAGPPTPLAATEPIPRFDPSPQNGRPVRIGLLDTRVFKHPALAGRYDADQASAFDSTANLFGTAGHATFIAGLMLQRAPGARLEVRAVLSDDDATALSWDVAKKMVEFSDVDILNMSFGCATHGKPPLALTRAIDVLTPKVVLVAAAGNYGDFKDGDVTSNYTGPTETTPQWPAAFPDVVAVGAHGPGAGFSSHGPWLDLLAPGVEVTSTFLPGTVKVRSRDEEGNLTVNEVNFGEGYAKWSGTSFAAANVAGEIAARMAAGSTSADYALDTILHPTDGNILPYAIPTGGQTR